MATELLVRKSADRVRLRRGYDWSDRYLRIVEAAKKIKGTFLIDGEAVVSDKHGIADFERLHSRSHDKSAMLWHSICSTPDDDASLIEAIDGNARVKRAI